MADSLDDLIVGVQNYVVAPLNAFGLGGYVFDIAGEGRATLSAEITDHYTEDNQAIQDHIAIKPKRITLKGYVGELVYNPPSNTPSALQAVTQKLTVIPAFLPQISAAATQAQAFLSNPSASDLTLNSVTGALPSAANIYGLVENLLGATGNQARQQNAYSYFSACQRGAVLMGIQTPWEFLTNMAVETIDVIQPEDSIFISDFSITFKQIRIAATLTATTPLTGTGGITQPGGPSSSSVAFLQGAAVTNQGIVPGMILPSEVLAGLPSQMTGAHSLSGIPGLQNLFSLKAS